MELRLQETQQERDALKKRVAELEDREEKVRRHPPSQTNESRLTAELETTKNSLQHCGQKLKEAQETASIFEASGQKLNTKYKGLQAKHQELTNAASKTDRRVAALVEQNHALSAQLKALRHDSKANTQESSLDVFSNRLDQVSEAAIKSGVESLNDVLDNFVMEILEKSDQLVQKHAHLVRPPSDREQEQENPVLRALAQPSLTEENRGLLLDVQLHDQLHSTLYHVFFSNDVLPTWIDHDGVVQPISEELSRREPWTVAQRWRALTAMGMFALIEEGHFAGSIHRQTEDIVELLAQAHGLTPTQFEDMSDALFSGLRAMYKEANELSVSVRRDILSVRMTVTTVSATHFDPNLACSVWPEMGAAAGDEIVGRYKFGLMKVTETGERFDLMKPEVATTALIRETSKSSS
ncbi:hypothetical protein B0H16DRAFT_1310330 [Mycena metata]|uniref:Uncharacterized protein n=1 Tax=Mycena metata TaxID=1033252 RepID=A0AAD7JHD2_9AGAR|nr:hypothetical protein B0H16DRAFT_1310330 [Mycena metata]